MMSDPSTDEHFRMVENAHSSPESMFMNQENKLRSNANGASYHYYHQQKSSIKNILVILSIVGFCANIGWSGLNFLHSSGWLSGLARSTDIDKVNLLISDMKSVLIKLETHQESINDKINSIDKSLALLQGQFMAGSPSVVTIPASGSIPLRYRQKRKPQSPDRSIQQTQSSGIKLF